MTSICAAGNWRDCAKEDAAACRESVASSSLLKQNATCEFCCWNLKGLCKKRRRMQQSGENLQLLLWNRMQFVNFDWIISYLTTALSFLILQRGSHWLETEACLLEVELKLNVEGDRLSPPQQWCHVKCSSSGSLSLSSHADYKQGWPPSSNTPPRRGGHQIQLHIIINHNFIQSHPQNQHHSDRSTITWQCHLQSSSMQDCLPSILFLPLVHRRVFQFQFHQRCDGPLGSSDKR